MAVDYKPTKGIHTKDHTLTPNIGRHRLREVIDDHHECLVGTCHDATRVPWSLLLGGVTLVQGIDQDDHLGGGGGGKGSLRPTFHNLNQNAGRAVCMTPRLPNLWMWGEQFV